MNHRMVYRGGTWGIDTTIRGSNRWGLETTIRGSVDLRCVKQVRRRRYYALEGGHRKQKLQPECADPHVGFRCFRRGE
jgi:hypothetical protein